MSSATRRRFFPGLDVQLQRSRTSWEKHLIGAALPARLAPVGGIGEAGAMKETPHLTASCACGRVECKASGKPIVSSACYCRDCQTGAAEIEALPHAGPVKGFDGGTEYLLYRKDRFACSKGADLLKSYKLKPRSATNRVVATCCNTAMFVDFDKGPFWVSAYRTRFQGGPPPLECRVCTKSKPESAILPNDVPNHPGYPPALIFKLLGARLAMAFGR